MCSVNAAVRMFAHLRTMLPPLSTWLTGLDFQWFSPLRFGRCFPLFHGSRPLLASAAFLWLSFSLSKVRGLRWFSDTVHHLKLSAQLLWRTVSRWSTTAPSKCLPQISGKAKATRRWTDVVNPFPSLYSETKMYPVFLFGRGKRFMLPLHNFNPPFECLTYLSNERIFPRLDTSYKPSYPLIGLQISI